MNTRLIERGLLDLFRIVGEGVALGVIAVLGLFALGWLWGMAGV